MTVWHHVSKATRYGKRTYVICLDCGKEFAYNWEEMRIEAAEPPAGFKVKRMVAVWIKSVRALSAMRALTRIVPSPTHLEKLRLIIMGIAIEALAAGRVLPAGLRTMARRAARSVKRLGALWIRLQVWEILKSTTQAWTAKL